MTATTKQVLGIYRYACEVKQEFGPNGIASRQARAKYAAQVREDAGWLAWAQPIELPAGPVFYHVNVGLNAKQIANPPDDDNLAAHRGIKAMRDGLADILSDGNDSHWRCLGTEMVPDPDDFGFIEFVIVAEGEVQ